MKPLDFTHGAGLLSPRLDAATRDDLQLVEIELAEIEEAEAAEAAKKGGVQ